MKIIKKLDFIQRIELFLLKIEAKLTNIKRFYFGTKMNLNPLTLKITKCQILLKKLLELKYLYRIQKTKTNKQLIKTYVKQIRVLKKEIKIELQQTLFTYQILTSINFKQER